MTVSKERFNSSIPRDDEYAIPNTLRPLIYVYRSLPPLCLPYTNFNISFTLLSTLLLAMIRTVVWQYLICAGWPSRSKMTTDAAASLTSILHGFVLCFYLGVCLYRNPRNYVPSARLENFPVWWQDAATAVLEICTGYMLFDFFSLVKDMTDLGVKFSELEVLVMMHHFLSFSYMVSCRLAK